MIITAESAGDLPEEAIKMIASGNVFVYPTDTVYGIGCIITSVPGIERVFGIKRRDKKNPLLVAFSNMDMLRKYAYVDEAQKRFIAKYKYEGYAFVLRKKDNIPDAITAGKDSVGIRIPDNGIVRGIIKAVGVPLVTTSANLSRKKAPASFSEIEEEIKNNVDLCIDGGRCKRGKPSRIIDLSEGVRENAKVIRD